MAKKKKSKKSNGDALATNRKALRDYTVIDRYEAGIVLRGTEVKSARNQQIGLTESYARVEKGEVFIYNLHIQPYEFGNRFNHPALRTRKLLLHAYEIKKLIGLTQLKGYSLIPLKCYLVRGHVKIQLGLCKGKLAQDKRETIKRRTADREAERTIAHHFRGA